MDIAYLQILCPWREPNRVVLSTTTDPVSPPLVYYESPGQARPFIVESVAEWRKLKAGEEAANLPSNLNKFLILIEYCYTCGIGIGPNHHEQQMFLYPVYNEYVEHAGGEPSFIEYAELHICGGCASNHRRRYLPDRLCILRPEHWETTILLCHEEGQQPQPVDPKNIQQGIQIELAINDHIRDCHWIFLLLLLIVHKVSLAWFINNMSHIIDSVNDDTPAKQAISIAYPSHEYHHDSERSYLDDFYHELCQQDSSDEFDLVVA